MSDGQPSQNKNGLFSQAAIEGSILSHLNSGVLVFDETGGLIYHNPAAAVILVKAGQDREGEPPEDLSAITALLEIKLTQDDQGSHRWEVELEGERFYEARLSSFPTGGRLLHLQEITSFKKLDQIKTEFVNSVAHDLRSPLTAVLGYVSLIDRVGPVNQDQQEFIQRAQNSVETIKNMIDKLLELGRIEAGYDEEMVETSVQELISSSVNEHREGLSQKEQQLSVDAPPDPVLVLGNPSRLRQALDNLIENAINYTPPGGEVQIHAWVEDEQAILQVQDTGMGISASDLPHVFDKLYRGANISDMASGAGLGLSIVKSIVESHQGRVWAKSSPEEGSTFTVVLPLYGEKSS